MKPILILLLVVGALTALCASADETRRGPFLPTWSLLNPEQKQYFISGYLGALDDVRDVLSITERYVKENPSKGLSAIEELRGIYKSEDTSPLDLSRAIDRFYSSVDNRDKGLSLAISSALTDIKKTK